MPRFTHRLAGIALGLGALLGVVPLAGSAWPAPETARRVGPPWISIEYPANPHDPASRGAFLVVNTFHHGTPMAFPIVGTAEGVVNGERRSVALRFRNTARPGVYALHKQWSDEGTWVLVISTHEEPGESDFGATALVSLARDGTIAGVEVPSRQQDGWTVPRRVTKAEIDALLQRRLAAR